ncbi:MAG: hypothetical protein JW969_10720 [Spirochaetales bacterium]|nr:hypothetical protein [Spirochaetales bacterium]
MKYFFLLSAFIMLSLSCVSGKPDNPFTATGTVRYISLEGGFYGIETDTGEKYDPVNLEDQYKVDGLRVRVVAELRDDLSSFHMWGMIIEIKEIKVLE